MESTLIPVDQIRHKLIEINQEEVNELIASIEEHGMVKPIIVRSVSNTYEIIAGIHRYIACCQIGHTLIPCDIR